MRNKVLCFLIFILSLQLGGFAQAKLDSLQLLNQEAVIQSASSPFSHEELNSFFEQQIQYPDFARDYAVEGTILVRFNVLKDGSIDQVEVIQGLGFGLDKEAKRLVSLMPDWNPARFKGRPFISRIIMPISFALQ